MTKRGATRTLGVVIAWCAGWAWCLAAPPHTAPPAKPNAKPGAKRGAEQRNFQELLQGTTLEGTFSVRGKDLPPQKDRYEIRQVTKQPEGDYWVLMTRVQYADHDVTFPVPVEVRWAGTTPVITVDSVTIPGLGTFDARVLLHDGLYAGTWRHGEISGHLWGEIKRPPAP